MNKIRYYKRFDGFVSVVEAREGMTPTIIKQYPDGSVFIFDRKSGKWKQDYWTWDSKKKERVSKQWKFRIPLGKEQLQQITEHEAFIELL